MPTILQVLPALGAAGGVERGTIEIAEAIVEAGGRAIVASSGGARLFDLERVGGEHIFLPTHSKNPWVIYANVARLVKLITSENVDLVHARSRAPAWSAHFAARQTGRKFVTTFHGTYAAGNILKRRYNSVMTRGDRVIAISSFIAEHVHRLYGVPERKIRTIHRGVDLNRFTTEHVAAERLVKLSTAWRLEDGLPIVMLPARLTRWKGQAVFIEAISHLRRQDIRCLIIGDDQGRKNYRQELESLIQAHKLDAVVRIVNHCEDMAAAFMLADVVVSASTDPEAFGRTLIEAQALGRPVIASDHGGARETIIEGKTGWRVVPGDAVSLASALKNALDLSEIQRANVANAAIANVRKNFSKQSMCARTLAVYNEVLKPHTRH